MTPPLDKHARQTCQIGLISAFKSQVSLFM